MPTLSKRLLRLFGLSTSQTADNFYPLPLGPSTSELEPGKSTFTILSGPLSGQTMRLQTTLQPGRADFFLWQADPHQTADSPLAHCHYDRSPDGTETLWDIFVHPEWRGRSLAGLLVRLSLRRLLLNRRHRIGLRMRKLMQPDTSSGSRVSGVSIRLQNIGIGLIAVKLGLVPEPALEMMLAPANISSFSIIPSGENSPPGYLFRLKTQPGLLTICRLDPGTGRPLTDAALYRRFTNPAELCRDCRLGNAIAGNIDYELTPVGAERCFRHIAATASEYQSLLRRLSRHQLS